MADGVLAYGDIWLGTRGGVASGQLKLTPAGFTWRRKQGSKTVEVKKDDVEGMSWMKVPRGCLLSVRQKAGPTVNFLGFRDKDLDSLQNYARSSLQLEDGIQEQQLPVSGHNWGSIELHGASLAFLVEGKQAFELPLPDVCTAQQLKDDVLLELHVDDTGGGEVMEDMLTEVTFYVPPTNPDFPGEGEEQPPSKVLLEHLLPHADTEAASAEEPVCVFAEVGVSAPRGRFDIEMHVGYLQLSGQSQDFKARYQNINRIFILPKSNTPHTLVVISLDPALRKGNQYYSHILCQFPTDDEASVSLDISPEQLAAINEKNGGKLQPELSGPCYDVFSRCLRGLSGARITRPGAFKNATQDGVSVRCSYKADDGQLYPLDKAFFYVHKPPMCIQYSEVESVEFARQGGGALSGSVRTFDLIVRCSVLKDGKNVLVEHQFRNIQRSEWQNLFDFIHAKKIPIDNLASAQRGPGGAAAAADMDDEMDPGMRRAAAEADDDDDEDEDFDAGASDGSEDDEDEDESGSEAEMVEEEGISAATFNKKKRKKEGSDDEGGEKEARPPPKIKVKMDGAGTSKASPAAKPAKEPKEPKEPKADGGKAEKKPRKKKDPLAPKKNLSAFMYFSNAQRDKVKSDNPGVPFGEVGKILGERWKALSSDDRAPYEAMAAKDKLRYAEAMRAYKGGGGGDAGAKDEEEGSGGEDGDGDDE